MLPRTPPGGNPDMLGWSPMKTRSQRAQELAGFRGAVPKLQHMRPDFYETEVNRKKEEVAVGGGEGDAGDIIFSEPDSGAGYVPFKDPVDNLRDLVDSENQQQHHNLQTATETLTRLQLGMIHRNADEMNRLKQSLRQEIQQTVRDEVRAVIQEELRQTLREELRASAVDTSPAPISPRRTGSQPVVQIDTPCPVTSPRNPEIRPRHSRDQYMLSRREPEAKLDSWGIKFDGDPNKISVDDFIFRVEHLRQYHGVSWSEVIGNFHKLLGQKASEWYWIQVRTTGIPDWPSLRQALRRTYSTHLTNFELERDLMERMQRPSEPIDDYIHEMCRLRAQLRTPLSEAEMVRVLKRNIKESVGRILFPMHITSVERLRAEYHAVERTFSNRYQHRSHAPPQAPRQYPRPQVNELWANDRPENDWDSESQPPKIEEVRAEVKCWNCQELGHTLTANGQEAYFATSVGSQMLLRQSALNADWETTKGVRPQRARRAPPRRSKSESKLARKGPLCQKGDPVTSTKFI